ncbi:MAG: hypothetical protein ACUVRL_09505 [Candidatus Saccharicenans sp.]|uniref:hypothetical protein n=1 Tax=Candidatus Saccharicenans sp. TaxID=2819258 RepID=UPI00404B3256
MKTRKLLVAMTLLLSFLLLSSASLQADTYLKQKTHTDSFSLMGQTQPAKDEITVIWIGKDKSRTDTDDRETIIMRMDKGHLFKLDHQKKTYQEMPLNIKKMIDKNAAAEGKEAEEFAKMAQEMAEAFAESMEVRVTPTSERQKIKNWNCRKYLLDTKMALGEVKSEAWATEELKIDWKSYLMLTNAMMAGSPGFEKMIDKIYQEMSKIRGVIVLQLNRTEVMNTEMKSSTELLEFGEKTAPEGNYDIPAGYIKIK